MHPTLRQYQGEGRSRTQQRTGERNARPGGSVCINPCHTRACPPHPPPPAPPLDDSARWAPAHATHEGPATASGVGCSTAMMATYMRPCNGSPCYRVGHRVAHLTMHETSTTSTTDSRQGKGQQASNPYTVSRRPTRLCEGPKNRVVAWGPRVTNPMSIA